MFHVEHHAKRGQGRVVVVKGLHPRSISTTTTIRLAQLFAFASESCLLIDLGPRGDATRRLGASLTQSGLLAAILSGAEPGGRLGLLVRSVAPGLDLVPYDLALDDVEVSGVLAEAEAWAQTLREFCAQYSWILIDCPPANPKLGRGCFAASDEILFTTTKPEYLTCELGEKNRKGDPGQVLRCRDAFGGALDLDSKNGVPEDLSYLRPDNSDWDDLETTLERRATRAYIALAKELRNGG
ncbi:MAG: ParA family protein [Planctomycetota bacterium]